ncbi:MAG TPA: PHB depolymerase family esterase [Candidatus Hydrogenedentes bacterium]|nr:PHB depolymerase family esterase [Candidatus Hydrogenedentota bacterium]
MGELEPRKEVSHGAIEHDGLKRTFRFVLPTNTAHGKSLPLVLVLHGGFGTGEKMAKLSGFDILARREGFIVVYPDGVNRHWNDGRGQHSDADDVGFIRKLIDHFIGRFGADPTRVYVTGASNGGMMALRLACELSDKIAAVAPVIASMPEPLIGMCRPTHPMPVLIMNGEQDPLVPWNGGEVRFQRRKLGKVVSTPNTVSFWVRYNGCQSEPRVEFLPDLSPGDGTRIRVERYDGGREGSEVVLYAVEGGGHTWPGGPSYLPKWLIGKTSRDIQASEVIWDFFKKHSRCIQSSKDSSVER